MLGQIKIKVLLPWQSEEMTVKFPKNQGIQIFKGT